MTGFCLFHIVYDRDKGKQNSEFKIFFSRFATFPETDRSSALGFGENRQDGEPFLEEERLPFPTTKRQGHESTRLVRTGQIVNPSLKKVASISYNKETGS